MLLSDVQTVPGVGPKTAQKLNQLDIETVEDLIYTLPYRYEDGTRLFSFAEADLERSRTYRVQIVKKSSIRYLRRGLKMQTVDITDGEQYGEMTFFNMPYLDRKLREGATYYIYGKPKFFRGRLQFSTPKLFSERDQDEALSITPVYPLVKGISQKNMKNFIQAALESVDVPEVVPDYLLKRYGLYSEKKALDVIHGPSTIDAVMVARQSLVFSEFLRFQLALSRFDHERSHEGITMVRRDLEEKILSKLPFTLTEGQRHAWCDIKKDMASGERMERLIQGDVGSGKTVLAFLAMARSVSSGYQAMMMAPTEILARQHYEEAFDLFLPYGVRVELLTGSTPAQKKRDVLEKFKTGACDILIGTHALFSEDLEPERLGLTVTDEQHRFGVEQRARLQEKESKSDRLIMTATPIPRSLGIVMYGNTKISSIRTMPKGRKPVETTAVGDGGLESTYAFMERFLKTGKQIYVVCPLIENNPDFPLHAAEDVYKHFKSERFKDYGIGLLHGQQSDEEKSAVMDAFQKNEYQILISTTVIEVGVNVVNANLLLVFDADRFGLATLHQLRGRVGRGGDAAYCILHSSNESKKAQERLAILAGSTDGFYIAEEDMKLRGGGDFFGTRQSGAVAFRVGDLFQDMDIMRYAKIEADAIIGGGHLNEREEPELLTAVEHYEERRQSI